MAGKGDKPRKVDGERFRNNFDNIFGTPCPHCGEKNKWKQVPEKQTGGLEIVFDVYSCKKCKQWIKISI